MSFSNSTPSFPIQQEDKMKEGYIKLFRCMSDWEWYKDLATKTLFLHCLLRANWKDDRFMGAEIKRGSFVSSRKNLAEESGLSEYQVRRALKNLEKSNEIITKTSSRFTVITVVKYDDFQLKEEDGIQQTKGQTTDQTASQTKGQTTHNIRNKEYKNKRNIYRPSQATNIEQRIYTDEMLNGLYKNMEEQQ